jgi:hypothetical protein
MRSHSWIIGLLIGSLFTGCAAELTDPNTDQPSATEPNQEQIVFNVSATTLATHEIPSIAAHSQLSESTTIQATNVVVDLPTNAAYEAGQVWPAIVVRVVDTLGQAVPSDETVNVALLPSWNGPQVHGTTTKVAVNGVAVFDDLYVTDATNVTFDVETWGGFDGVVKDVEITVAPSETMTFDAQIHAFAQAGDSLDITIQARDAYGNHVEGYTGTLSFSSTDEQALLPEPVTLTEEDNGSVTLFGEVNLRTAGTQTITITDEDRSLAIPVHVIIRPAPVAKLTLVSPPLHVQAGMLLTPAPAVKLLDAYGNGARATSPVQIELVGGPHEAQLLGTTEITPTSSTVSFDHIAISHPGDDYVLVVHYDHVESLKTLSFPVCGPECFETE